MSRAHAYPALTAEVLLDAWVEADRLRGEILREMERFPVLLTPVCATGAFLHGARSLPTEQGPVDYLDAMRYTQWWNLMGAPAVVVPVHGGAALDGKAVLPAGVQVAGRPWEDERVLAVAGVVDEAFGFRAPPPLGA